MLCLGHETVQKICDSIKLCNENKIETIIAVTLKHNNVKELSSFIKMKKQLNFTYLRFEFFLPIKQDVYNLSLTENDIDLLRNKIDELKKYDFVIFPNYHKNENCGAGKYSVFINSDLTLAPCDLQCDLLKTKNKISKDYSLSALWNKDAIFTEWRKKEYTGCKLFNNGGFFLC